MFKVEEAKPQWYFDRMKHYSKAISKLRAKMDHLVNDLHKRVAYDLVKNNDIILMPSFKIQGMINKKGGTLC